MIKFDESTMTKATFNQSIILCDNNFGITPADDDEPLDEFAETEEGLECWVFNNVKCDSFAAGDAVFVYIPNMDYATVILNQYVDLENKQG
ncbi:hypothetical protein vBVpP1_55 [Vibrio phage vB_VpP_1]|nr:hypothetical protein vBVpP1_55 [Vibrio phage vB_VpP_1]